MALLKSADSNPDLDYYEYRDYLFYHKYRYRLRIYLRYFRYLMTCKSVLEFKNKITKHWTFYNRLSKDDIIFLSDNFETYKNVLEFMLDIRKSDEYTTRSDRTTLCFYGNDLSKFKEISSKINTSYDLSEAISGSELGTKYFSRQPKYKFRVYLKDKIVPKDFIQSLKDILTSNNNLNPSKSLDRWLHITDPRYTYMHKYCRGSYYIDYSDESMLSYLLLMHGEILGKKYKLEKRQYNM